MVWIWSWCQYKNYRPRTYTIQRITKCFHRTINVQIDVSLVLRIWNAQLSVDEIVEDKVENIRCLLLFYVQLTQFRCTTPNSRLLITHTIASTLTKVYIISNIYIYGRTNLSRQVRQNRSPQVINCTGCLSTSLQKEQEMDSISDELSFLPFLL